MSKLWDDLFGARTTAAALPGIPDNMYDAIANNYGAAISGHNSMPGHANAIKQNLPPRPAPEPKDIPALAISLDVAYDLWAAKYGYDWVNINTVSDMQRLYQHKRYPMGGVFVPTGMLQTPTITRLPLHVADDTEQPEPEPEFDWYTVARRLVHVRALENEGGYYRLVPKEWFK